jgi:8-oxo-dGTP diphosphatase
MQGYNCIMVYNTAGDRLLMCKRAKDPYKGMSNLVGGKIEPGEDGLAAAYRELWEETALTREHIELTHLMDFTYYVQDCYVEIYVGRLHREVEVSGDENELYWSGLDENFFDLEHYAGEGNIGHMVEQVKAYKEILSRKRVLDV